MGHSFKTSWFTVLLVWLLVTGLAGCKGEDPYAEYEKRQRELDDQLIQKYLTANNITNYTKTTTGLYYLPQQPGTGAKVQKGNTVTMNYVGYSLQTGLKFDSSYDRGLPLSFEVGRGQVIKGWDEGATLLTNKEKASLIVPSHLGYGAYSTGGSPGGVLLFNVSVEDVK